jgi:hypothetical protein
MIYCSVYNCIFLLTCWNVAFLLSLIQSAAIYSIKGLYAGPPGFSFIKFPSLYITEDLDESTCVSKDGLRVRYQVTFQYQMPPNWLLPAILKYRNFENWARIVAAAGDSAVQHTCSLFGVSKWVYFTYSKLLLCIGCIIVIHSDM